MVACAINSILYPEYYIVITPSVHPITSHLSRKFRLLSCSAFLTVDVRPVGRRILSDSNDGSGGNGIGICNVMLLLHSSTPLTPILLQSLPQHQRQRSTPNSVEKQARRYHGAARHKTASAMMRGERA